MSRVSDSDAPLINDVEFLEELERLEQADERGAEAVLDSRVYADAINGFDGLDRGLPMAPAAGEVAAAEVAADEATAPVREPTLIDQPYEPCTDTPRSAEKGISFAAAALVLLACLTLGAATAALVFHDQLTQITAPRLATR